MNFLAHLHIAESCQSSFLGNLLGDFVKGNPEGRYPEPIVHGIRLHRFVDVYTDSHPIIDAVKQRFSGPSRRFAAIALDVFWDHCLARQWTEFHALELPQFCAYAHAYIEQELNFPAPERFYAVHQKMWQGRWLESYGEMENIEFALQRMAARSARMQPLATCYPFLEAHYDVLWDYFTQFYPMVLSAAKAASVKAIAVKATAVQVISST